MNTFVITDELLAELIQMAHAGWIRRNPKEKMRSSPYFDFNPDKERLKRINFTTDELRSLQEREAAFRDALYDIQVRMSPGTAADKASEVLAKYPEEK